MSEVFPVFLDHSDQVQKEEPLLQDRVEIDAIKFLPFIGRYYFNEWIYPPFAPQMYNLVE